MPRDVSAIEIPEELLPLLQRFEKPEVSISRLEELGKTLETKRLEAIADRENAGIDNVWANSEEAYHGIDDMNRHEFNGVRWSKPTSMDAPVQTDSSAKASGGAATSVKSTAYVRLTSRYVDAGAAKIAEILLSDKSFSIEPTPVPSLIDAQRDKSQLQDQEGRGMWREAFPDEFPVESGAPLIISQQKQGPEAGARPQELVTSADKGQFTHPVPMTKQDAAIQTILTAKSRAKRAETQIYDWMIECGHNYEMRKMLFDAARLGVGIIKGPIPEHRRTLSAVKGSNGKIEVRYVDKIVPADRCVDPWNIFPSPDCGENICNGTYVFERQFVSQKQLEDLIGLPGYIESQINKAIELGPQLVAKKSTRNPSEKELKDVFEMWFFTGSLGYEDFKSLNADAAKDIFTQKNGKPPKSVFAVVTMVNGIPIKGSLNPLQSGSINYYSFPWQRRSGRWDGIGVAEQIQVPQRIVTAATRALLNNAGISAGPQIILNKEGVTPADGKMQITPNKIWYATNDGLVDDVQKAFFCFDITNVTSELMEVINYGLRLGEECTNIPLVTQGQSGDTTPETYGATQLQNNNANQLLRSIAYTIDGCVTGPLVNAYYEYLLLDPTIDEEVKGDARINAKGSVALVERSIQNQTIVQMSPLALNPVYGVDPKKWFAQMARANYLDPADFQYTPEEQAKIDSQPPPLPPNVQVAQINAKTKEMQIQMQMQQAQAEQQLQLQIANIESQTELAAEKMANETAQLKVKMDTDRDTVYVRSEMARAQADYTNKREELALKKELAIMDFASKHQLSLDQVKAKLADTAMRLRVQKELAAADAGLTAKLHTTPSASDLIKAPTEPPGRAPNGSAFTK